MKLENSPNSAKHICLTSRVTTMCIHHQSLVGQLPVGMWFSWLEHRTGELSTAGSIPRCGRGFFSQSTFSADSLTVSVRTSPCAVACIYIYAHVTDLVVHVRVWWIMETLKHPACTGGWVVRLCRSWLSPGKATQISRGRKPIWTIHLYSCKKYFKKEKEQKKL